MAYKNNLLSKKRKAFTLIELLIVIAIIGILFIVLISKVDFATDKAKVTGVQTDFRSFQLAFETVAREQAGFSSLVDGDDYSKLEDAINKNLDSKLNVVVTDGNIIMANSAEDPGGIEYHGTYIAGDDGKDRGCLIMYSNGANFKFGSEATIAGGVATVFTTNDDGKDDYSMSVVYSLKNGYGEVKTTTTGFSQNQGGSQAGTEGTFIPDNGGNDPSDETPLVCAPANAGATFRGYLICSHSTNGVYEHDDSCFVFEEVTLTWEELKDPANGEKYSYNASAIGDTVLGSHAFEECHSVASINIPEGITLIEECAFAYTYIHDFKLPSTLKEIGERAFECTYGCANLYIPDGVEVLGKSVAVQTALRSVRIPGTVKVIPDYAFEFSPLLKTVVLEEGIEFIGNSSFDYCPMLSEFTIPSTVTCIDRYAFAGCPSMTTIKFAPNSQLKTIGDSAFYDNIGLISVTIPDSVQTIEQDAFCECPKLVEIINLSGVELTNNNVDDVSKVDIHNGSTKVVNQNGYLFYNIDGVNYLMGTDGITGTAQPPEYYNGETYRLHSYVFCGEHGIDNYIIPNTITEVPDGAFSTCYKTDSIFIPSSVTTLGYDLLSNYSFSINSCGDIKYSFAPDDKVVATIIFEDNCTLQNVNDCVWACSDCDIINVHITDVDSWNQIHFQCVDYYLYVNGELVTQ